MSSSFGASRDDASRQSFAPLLILLGLAIVINYVDRGNLSIAAPIIKSELQLSATQLGLLFSAFFYTYTALQFVVGGVVDRLGANRVLSAGLVLWSFATIAMGFAGGFIALLAWRLLLGVGESVAFPCTSKVIAQHIPAANRGLANGVVTAGLKFGPAVGAFGAGMLIAKFGWRPVFWGMGIVSLLWVPAWWKWRPREELSRGRVSATIGHLEIFRERDFWGCAAGHFSFNYVSYFFLTWLPFYLSHERHLSQQALARAAGAYYLLDSASALLTGWLCDRWIQRGANAVFVRKAASAGGHALAAVAMIACAFAGTDSYYPWLLLAAVGSGAAACVDGFSGGPERALFFRVRAGCGNFSGRRFDMDIRSTACANPVAGSAYSPSGQMTQIPATKSKPSLPRCFAVR